MNNWKKLLAMALCLCLFALAGCQAIAEDTATDAATPAVTELAADTLLATVNGQAITWTEVQPWYNSVQSQYAANYDFSDPATVQVARAIALENAINEALLLQKGVELGLDQVTDDERATIEANAEADWQSALDRYMSVYGGLTETSTDEEKAAALQVAQEYFTNNGYSLEKLKVWYVTDALLSRVQDYFVKDVVVTDEEVEAEYQALLAADKEAYGADVSAYEQYNSYVEQMALYNAYYGAETPNMRKALYRPAGFRSMQHLYIKVDEALLNQYVDLRARLEEQMDAEAKAAEETPAVDAEPTAAPDVTPEPTAEPVTQAQVDQAYADVLASVQTKLDEINQKVADGVPFEDIIKDYDADGSEDQIFEVSVASEGYVPEFVSAAFSVDEIGEISAPVVSELGVHILKYLADVPEGPVEFTDAERAALKEDLLSAKKSDAYYVALEQAFAAAAIEYTGVIPSMEEMAAAEDGDEAVEVPVEPEATDAPAETVNP